MAPETQVRRIVVKFDTQGDKDLKNIKNSLASMNKEVKKTSDAVQSFQSVYQGILGASFLGASVGSIVGVADSMQKLNDRLVNTEGSAEAAGITMGKLRDVANATNSGIEDLATVYARLSLSLGDTGIKTDGLLGLTLALQNSFRLSGSTAAEATASVIQLSQGLASGQLRGQELRSVLEQNAVVGELLAKQLKITRGELLKFAEKEGGIKAKDFLLAIANSFDDLNARAKNLQPTIGEAMTKAFNDLKISLNTLNKEFGVTEKVVSGIEFLSKNIVGLGLAIGGLTLVMQRAAIITAFTTAVGYLASAIGVLSGAMSAIYTTIVILLSPLYAIPTAIALVVTGVGLAIASFFDWGEIADSLSDKLRSFGESIGLLEKTEKVTVNMQEITKASKDLFESIKGPGIQSATQLADSIISMGKASIDARDPMKLYGDALREAANNIKAPVKEGKVLTLKDQLEALNSSFNNGKIDVQTYNSKLLDLTDRMSDKKGPLNKFKEMGKVLRENLGREFEYGLITLQEYTVALKSLEALQLEEAFRRGAISVDEYHKKIIETSDDLQPGSAIYTGTAEYIKSVGTLSQNVAGVVTGVFNKLEDALVEFTKNGKLSFKDFANAVIEDINRVIIRSLIVKPLAEGILNFAGSAFASSATGTGGASGGSSVANTPNAGFQALGGAWENGVQKFASGGIVNRTTPFGMAGGRTGIMGEAGPEAIIPLRRNGKGELGISGGSGGGSNVQVNIINNAGVEIEQRETKNSNGDRALDVIITANVKEAFNSGAMDRQMSSQYGLRRRGV